METNFEVNRMVTISMRHITVETEKKLSRGEEYLVPSYEKDDYGWFIYIDKNRDTKEIEELPKDLNELYHFASKNNFDMVCLDIDGPVIRDLPDYRFSERENPLRCDNTPFRDGMIVRSNTKCHF